MDYGLGNAREAQFDQAQNKVEHECSFCGQKASQLVYLIIGHHVNICDGCVILCNDLLKDKRVGPRGKAVTAIKSLKNRSGDLIGDCISTCDLEDIFDAVADGKVEGLSVWDSSR